MRCRPGEYAYRSATWCCSSCSGCSCSAHQQRQVCLQQPKDLRGRRLQRRASQSPLWSHRQQGGRLSQTVGTSPLMTDEIEDVRSWLTEEGQGIFLLSPRFPGDAPRLINVDRRRLFRFFDYIYIPSQSENLSPAQVHVVNVLRLRLMLGGYSTDAHARVKARVVSAVISSSPQTVLEWGCGYDALNLRFPSTIQYVGVDLDREVVDFQSVLHVRCHEPSDDALRPLANSIDMIVSVFVFHFAIAEEHAIVMWSLLKNGGQILANVYRRNAQSRDALRSMFQHVGFTVARLVDPERLCADHEYWLLGREIDSATLDTRLANVVHAGNSSSAASGLRPQLLANKPRVSERESEE